MKPTFSNNKKAPRLKKGEFSNTIVTKELWRAFIRDHPEHKGMTWTQFFGYWKDIAETARKEIVENPLGIKLGFYTGEIKLQYLPSKQEAYDMNVTANGAKIKHLNIMTRGKVAKIKWERRWAVKFLKMLQFFAFEPTREINLMANKYIEANPDKLRVARNTMGGHSIWRQLKKNDK